MFDIMKPINLKKDTPHIDAIHGHTTIELKDVKTGIRERIESDNLVTGEPAKLLQYNMPFMTQFSNSYTLFEYIFGGIMLFDKAIPTSPTPAEFMPADTKMVANGCHSVTQVDNVTEFGMFNSLESELSNKKFKQVYDYPTTHGNGTIRSVCLSNRTGGYIGYGNSTSRTSKSSKYTFGLRNSTSIGISLPETCQPFIVFKGLSSGYFYVIPEAPTSSTTTIRILKYSFTSNTIDDLNMKWGQSQVATLLDSFTVQIPAPGFSTPQVLSNPIDNTFIIGPSYWTTGQASGTLSKIDPETRTVTSHTITCSGNGTHPSIYWQDPAFTKFWTDISAGYQSDRLAEYDLVNDTLRYFDFYRGISGNFAARQLTNDLVLFGYNSSSSSLDTYIYNMPSDDFIITNGRWSGSVGYSTSEKVFYTTSVNGTTLTVNIYDNPFKFTTINNLSSPVLKTADKTMKVTYTLTME